MANDPLWTSDAIHVDRYVCVDVKATVHGVTLGQVHGDRNSFASDLHLSTDNAEALAYALLEGVRTARDGGAA